jgi:phosphatidylserine/phosphatidylglycerophosphate/cardiolipin synthase-like enzyme
MAITVTFLQQDRQRPEEIAAQLAEFLRAARTSLHLAVYDFHLSGAASDLVLGALRDRVRAGVDVRIAFDAGKPEAIPSPTRGDPARPGATQEYVRGIGDGIAYRPITGGDPRQPKLMHQKYVVRDAGTPAAAVWTGSANWTDDSWTLQENNLLRIDSPALANYYETDFKDLWARGDIGTSGLHDKGTVPVGAGSIDVAFAPGEGEGIDHAIAHRIGTARRRIKLCSMLLTSGAILRALSEARQKAQVAEYGGIYDRTQMDSVLDQWKGGPSAWKAPIFAEVVRGLSGKPSTPYTPGGRHDFMHNKVVVCDDVVLTGSFNLSHSATQNAENVLFLHDAALAERYNDYIDSLVKRYQGQS